MNKSKKDRRLLLNTVTPLLLEVVTIISGFIIPRLILSNFGSSVNGLIQSITQFLYIISFMEMGVGSVIRFNLYKPLSNHDNEQISKVVIAANKFFKTLALLLIVYSIALIFLYPSLIKDNFDLKYTGLLIASMSISSFTQYYFGQVNQILLTADQKGYIQYVAQIFTIILNTVACAVLINHGASIHMVKFCTSVIFLIRPLFLYWYVRKNYKIDYKLKYDEDPIKQKWNGVAQHVSAVVLDQTDVIVLTFLSSLSNVSIYAAYNMIVSGVKRVITTATSGIQAKLGALIAEEKENELFRFFSFTEWIIHTIAVFLFGCTLVLVVPFILVYTRGINDTNYNVNVFAILLTIANAGHSFRLPYSILILSAGHYKQTQNSYWLAALINILISIIFVYRFGLIGVAIGTLVAMLFQTIYMANYSYSKILNQPIKKFWIQIFVDFITLGVILLASKYVDISVYTYYHWLLYALGVAFIIGGIVFLVNLLFYRDKIIKLINLKK